MSPPLRLGVLGAARIAPRGLIEPAHETPRAVVAGVAARDPERARTFAATHGVPRVFPDYQALIDSPEIDAVYNALPPALHAPWTLAALRAGKHVLCEKPFAMNAPEAREMVDTARACERVLMEAVHSRYHPLFGAVLRAVQEGRIGALLRLDAVFTAMIPLTEESLRHDPALGGGALMDLGTYCIHWCRTLAGREPRVVSARSDLTPTGVDLRTRIELDFGAGLTAGVFCAMDEAHHTALSIVGALGRIDVSNPLIPHRPHRVLVQSEGRVETLTFTERTTYAFQLDAFLDAVASGAAPLTGGEDAVRNMQVIDAAHAKARAG